MSENVQTSDVPAPPAAPTTPNFSAMGADEVLAYTRTTRLNMVAELTKENVVPESNADKNLLTSTLDGLDRQVIQLAKIKADTESANKVAEAAAAINHLLNSVKHDVYSVPAEAAVARSLPEVPVDVLTIVEVNLVPGELDSTFKEETIDEFKARVDQTPS